MNQPDVSFPATPAQLRVKRTKARPNDEVAQTEGAMSAETRHRLEQDLEALRVQEKNLLAYEMHLREWQAQLDQTVQQQQGTRFAAPSTLTRFVIPAAQAPQAGEGSLAEGWSKLHRARALLETEQRHLVDDRLALREQETLLKQREAALATRERRLEEQEERQRAALLITHKPVVSSRSPFAVAKSMLGLKA